MGRALIKPKKDEDFYVEWSSFWDAPIKWGPRRIFEDDWDEREFARVDEYGVTSGWPGGWGESLIFRGEEGVEGSVKAEDLKDLIFAIVKKDDLTPFITSWE
jgi:hypothetical protein